MKLLKNHRRVYDLIGGFLLAYLLIGAWLVFNFSEDQAITPVPTKDLSSSSASNSAITGKNFSFIVFGDSGVGSQAQKDLAAVMEKKTFDLILHTGDVAYMNGAPEEIQKNVVDVYQNLFTKASFYPSLGNHDYGTNSGQPYLDTWQLPGNERYYSFIHNGVLFIALDTNESLDDKNGEELSWLEKTLSDNTQVKWKIAYFHHPPYLSKGNHSSDERVRKKLVPLFEKHNVDLVFSGHEHTFQRTCLIRDNTCQSNGVLYIVTGGGGAPLYKVGNPEWFTAKQIPAHHFVLVEKSDCQLNSEVVGLKNETLDQFSMGKC